MRPQTFALSILSLIGAGCVGNTTTKPLTISSATASGLGISDHADEPVLAETVVGYLHTMNSATQRSAMTALLNASDAKCKVVMVDVLNIGKSTQSVLGISALGLSTAGGLSSPTRSANILSGLASFVIGTEDELKDTILGGNDPNLIYDAVWTGRAILRSKIMTLLNEELGTETDGVVATRAFSEIEAYDNACGVTDGENTLRAALQNQFRQAREEGEQLANPAPLANEDPPTDPAPSEEPAL